MTQTKHLNFALETAIVVTHDPLFMPANGSIMGSCTSNNARIHKPRSDCFLACWMRMGTKPQAGRTAPEIGIIKSLPRDPYSTPQAVSFFASAHFCWASKAPCEEPEESEQPVQLLRHAGASTARFQIWV